MSRYSDLVMSLAPVAYWRLGEAGGTVAADQAGQRPGTYVSSPTLGAAGALAGDTDTAVTFSGTSQRASATSPVLGAPEASFAFWLKSTASNVHILGDPASSTASRYLVDLTSTGKITLSKGGSTAATSALSVNDGGWHFAVVTLAADRAAVVYIDGVADGTGTAVNADFSVTQTFGIGAYGTGTPLLNGTLDELAVWSRALTSAEVAQLYATGTGAISGYTAIAQALALRFDPAQVQAPAGYGPIRLSTHALPDQLPPTPCVLVFPESGDFDTGNGTRTGTQQWTVRFYYDQAMDLPRQSVALMEWATVLVDQLRASAQLGGLVARATVDSWSSGELTYADQRYSGIELKVSTATSESWSAAA